MITAIKNPNGNIYRWDRMYYVYYNPPEPVDTEDSLEVALVNGYTIYEVDGKVVEDKVSPAEGAKCGEPVIHDIYVDMDKVGKSVREALFPAEEEPPTPPYEVAYENRTPSVDEYIQAKGITDPNIARAIRQGWSTMDRTVHPHSKEARDAKEIYGNLMGKEIKHHPMPKPDEIPMQTNYVHVEEGSQLYTDLSQLVETMRHNLYRIQTSQLDKGLIGRGEKQVFWSSSVEENIAYILKGLENTIAKGFILAKSSGEDGMITVEVKVGSLIIPPETAPFVPRWILDEQGMTHAQGTEILAEKEVTKPDKEAKIDNLMDALIGVIYECKEEDFPSNVFRTDELREALKQLLQ